MFFFKLLDNAIQYGVIFYLATLVALDYEFQSTTNINFFSKF